MMVLSASFDDAPLQPGGTFAGRYRLVHRIRAEGACEVWRADDLVIGTPVALRMVPEDALPPGTSPDTLRQTPEPAHPAICPIFDVGLAEARFYCSMELISGENVRTIVRRVGRFPHEKVVDIGRQVCAALAPVHAEGDLHGHLNATNVFLDAGGAVRIIGVGLSSLPDFAVLTGGGEEPAAVPPEETAGTRAGPVTDIYSIGALLYELLTGIPPVRTGSGRPAKPSSLVPGISAGMDRLVLQALDPDPAARPQSVDALAAQLTTALPVRKPQALRVVLAGLALAAVIVLLAVAATRLLPSAAPPVTEHDAIVLADVSNRTGEAVFDGALKIGLAVALEQSPFLRVFPDDRARETLRLMNRRPDEPLTPALAREIAQREQLKALVAGSIERSGMGYLLVLEAMDAATGDVIAREQVNAAGQEQVLDALGAAAARVRATLGETLASIRRFDVPLPQATTTSLEALHAYALAFQDGRLALEEKTVPHLRRAIELDPNFAMAYAALSGVYRNTGRSAEAPEFARRAFELRDRVSERERFFISWRYYVDAAQAWDLAYEVAQSWTRTYPRDAFAFNSMGLAAAAFGDHERAVDAFRESIRLDEKFVPPHGNLAGSLLALDRPEEARAELEEADERGIAFITVRRMRFMLALVENDRAAMRRELDLLRLSPDGAWASILDARAAVFDGRTDAAHDLFQAAVKEVLANDARELAAQWTAEDAEAHAVAGACDQARRELNAGVALSRDSFTLERAARTLAICGDSAGARRMAEELGSRFPTATLTTRLQIPVIRAADALRQGDPKRALTLLEAVAPYDRAPSAEFWPAYLRGEAYSRLKDGPAAQAQFRSIVEHRGLAPTSPLYSRARLKLAEYGAAQ